MGTDHSAPLSGHGNEFACLGIQLDVWNIDSEIPLMVAAAPSPTQPNYATVGKEGDDDAIALSIIWEILRVDPSQNISALVMAAC